MECKQETGHLEEGEISATEKLNTNEAHENENFLRRRTVSHNEENLAISDPKELACILNYNSQQWQIIAKILDRFFLIIFPITTLANLFFFLTVGLIRMNEIDTV